jgi:Family of unknown function (DUF6527)
MRPDLIISHEFVEFIPEKLQEKTIYVSFAFATVVHKCCCGCGNEVVTPLSPTDWKLIFDGKTISLDPSIGNWSFPCRSHYWIRRNTVRWAEQWASEEIDAGRTQDALAKAKYFGASTAPVIPHAEKSLEGTGEGKLKKGIWKRLMKRFQKE